MIPFRNLIRRELLGNRRFTFKQPELPVLALTSRSEKFLIARLIEVGAQGYCLKGIAAETLVLAIRSVAAGASWWDQTATTEIRASFKSILTQRSLKADMPLAVIG